MQWDALGTRQQADIRGLLCMQLATYCAKSLIALFYISRPHQKKDNKRLYAQEHPTIKAEQR